jgi:chromosome segregation ATPase
MKKKEIIQSQLRSKHIRTLEVLQSMVTENAKLKEEMEKLREIRDCVKKKKESEAEANELRRENSKLKESVESIRSQRDEAYHDLQNLGKQVTKLETELEDVQRERESGRSSSESFKQYANEKIDSLKKSLVKSKENCRNTKSELKEMNKKCEHLETVLRKLKLSQERSRRLGDEEEKRKTNRENKEMMESTRKEYLQLLERFRQQESELKEYSEMKLRHEALLREHGELDAVCKETRISLLNSKKENEELRRRLEDTQDTAKNSSSFAKFVSLKEENRELSSKLKKVMRRRRK